MDDPAAPPAGWFGKVPALGDFASRRLPAAFTERWDPFVARGLQRLQQGLGEAWLDAYLNGPLWRFALMPGLIDERHWAGVLMPSVDRVGRYYPLTIAASFGLPPGPPFAPLQDWFDRIAHAALRCLAPGASVESLEADLHGAGLPQLVPFAEFAPAADGAALWLPESSAVAKALTHLAVPLVRQALRGSSLWWPWRTDDDVASLAVCRGLPDTALFARLLGGEP